MMAPHTGTDASASRGSHVWDGSGESKDASAGQKHAGEPGEQAARDTVATKTAAS